jgi:hypothetical protein
MPSALTKAQGSQRPGGHVAAHRFCFDSSTLMSVLNAFISCFQCGLKSREESTWKGSDLFVPLQTSTNKSNSLRVGNFSRRFQTRMRIEKLFLLRARRHVKFECAHAHSRTARRESSQFVHLICVWMRASLSLYEGEGNISDASCLTCTFQGLIGRYRGCGGPFVVLLTQNTPPPLAPKKTSCALAAFWKFPTCACGRSIQL